LFLGVALSWRLLFLVCLPPLWVAIERRRGARIASLLVATSALASATITLPFLIYEPASFSPLHTLAKVTVFDSTLPGALFILPLLAVGLGLGITLWSRPAGDAMDLLGGCVGALALPVVAAVVLHSVQLHSPQLAYSAFGGLFLPVGIAWAWLGIRSQSERNTVLRLSTAPGLSDESR
jgi:drug/metabolite transporter superfamily protein YnfA